MDILRPRRLARSQPFGRFCAAEIMKHWMTGSSEDHDDEVIRCADHIPSVVYWF